MARDVVTLTETLVAVDTAPGSSTTSLCGLLAERAQAKGAHVVLQDGAWSGVPQQNLVARWGGDGPAGLVLAGHLDTVPWEDGQRATTSPARDGRTLFGRGTCDMKGAVAAQLLAVEQLADELRRPVVLAWTYAEEVGCHGAQRLVREVELMGNLAEAVCIVGEPTDLVPICAHKGYGVARVQLSGVPVHSSDPWAGADASVALGTLLRDLHELREALRREGDPDGPHQPPGTTLNTGLVRAGTARNVVPDRAEVSVEFRAVPGSDLDDLHRRLQACVDLACSAAPGVEGRLLWDESLPPFDQPRDDRLVKWLSERTGNDVGTVPFYTEAELYRGGFSVPTAVCGPGSIAQAHRVDESVEFDALESGVELYADAIRHFCG